MSKFVSNVITLFSATLLGQILGIIASPILSRLYSPADFGIYQLVFSIVSLITIVACLSYNGAINLAKKDEDAATIVILCLYLTIIITCISAVLLWIFSALIENVLKAPGLSSYLFLVPFAVIASSIAAILYSWLSRRQQFGTIAQANLSSSVTGKTASIGLGLLSPSPFGLICGPIINDTTICLVSLRKTLVDFPLFRKVSFDKIRQVAIRYKKFPQFSTGSSLMSVAASQCIPFMLAVSFSPVVVGFYAMTYVIITLPLKLMGNSLSSVFYQKACEEKNRTGSIIHVMKSVNTRLISIGMFICLILMIIGPELFSFVLGAKWLTAGIYAQILAPWFFVVFISTPLGSIFNVFEKQGASLGFNVVLLISRIIVVLIGGFFGDPVICMVLLSATGVIFWTWMNMYLLKMGGVPVRDAMHEIARFLVLGVTISMPLIIAKFLSLSSYLVFGIAIVVTVVYYMIVVYQDPLLKDGLINFLTNLIAKKE
jgi:O-antigen/teichoic acid export membrane protein